MSTTLSDLDELSELRPDAYAHVLFNGRDYRLAISKLAGESRFVFSHAELTEAGKYVSTSETPITEYSDGTIYLVSFTTTPTGSCTLNIDGKGDVAIKKMHSGAKVDLAAGDVESVLPTLISFDGTDFIILGNPSLSHEQNTDSKLAAGTINEVTAAELKDALINKPAFSPVISFADATTQQPSSPSIGDAFVLTRAVPPYPVETIQWQSGTTIRYRFEEGEYDNMHDYGAVGSYAKITGSMNPNHNGTFVITGWDYTDGWIEISNPFVSDSSQNETGSPAIVTVTLSGWRGSNINAWVRFIDDENGWEQVMPTDGQTVVNISNKETYVFKAGTWTSQTYVLPEQPKPLQLLYDSALFCTDTADHEIKLNLQPGAVGHTHFAIVDVMLTNHYLEDFGDLDDFELNSSTARGGDTLFTCNSSNLANLVIDSGFITCSTGDIIRSAKVIVGTSIYSSWGVAHGGSPGALQIRIFGYPLPLTL